MKKTLLIGGAGFIGYNITKYLAEERNNKLTIADNFFRGKMDDHLTALVNEHGIKIIEGDFTDPVTFNKLETDYDEVYMLVERQIIFPKHGIEVRKIMKILQRYLICYLNSMKHMML